MKASLLSHKTELKRVRNAVRANDYSTALALLNPLIGEADATVVWQLVGDCLTGLCMYADAAAAYDQAARTAPPIKLAKIQLAATHARFRAGNTKEALASAMRLFLGGDRSPEVAFIIASQLSPQDDWNVLKDVYPSLLQSEDPEHMVLAVSLIENDRRNPDNILALKKLCTKFPRNDALRMRLAGFLSEFCDFDGLAKEDALLREDIRNGRESVFQFDSPHSNLMRCSDERLNRIATNGLGLEALDKNHAAVRRGRPHIWAKRLRIGYLSNDFWDQHATMRLLQHVLELHDRDKFDVTLFCYTPQPLIEIDRGGRGRWGKIVRIDALDDAAAADTLRAYGIDILIDLKGPTSGSRIPIVNSMIAPIQVSWLGFPGSAPHIDYDYIIGDGIVLPDSSKPFYHEKFCLLPGCYQPNDPVHRPRVEPMTRQDVGLPEEAFVFASFNANRKISLQTVKLWVDILKRSSNTVLWIFCDSLLAEENIRRKFAAEGIRKSRLIFAGRAPYEHHISRMALADLGLDTFPYNGHTTTSDMLWAGLPILTSRGTNFASRVSESLLVAAGIPELVAPTYADFCETAVALAGAGARLASLRSRLAHGKPTSKLFNSELFCRNLEAAYTEMAKRAKTGLPPDHFSVA